MFNFANASVFAIAIFCAACTTAVADGLTPEFELVGVSTDSADSIQSATVSKKQIDPERLFAEVAEQLDFRVWPRLTTTQPEKTKAFFRLDEDRSNELKSLLTAVHSCALSKVRGDRLEHLVIECFETRDAVAATVILTGLSEVVAAEEAYAREHEVIDGYRNEEISHKEFETLRGTLSRVANRDVVSQQLVHGVRARAMCEHYVLQVSIQTGQRLPNQQIVDAFDLLCGRLAAGEAFMQETDGDRLRQALESVQPILRDNQWAIDSRKLRANEIDAMLGRDDQLEIRFDEGLEAVEAIQYRNVGVPGRMRKYLVIVLMEYETVKAASTQAEPFGDSLDLAVSRFGIKPESLEDVTVRELESGEQLWTVAGELRYMKYIRSFRISSMQRGDRLACWIEMHDPIDDDQIPELADLLFDE